MAHAHVRPSFDLQSHSVHSDGALPAADVVAHAAAAGLELMALTDHDTVDGVPEALRAAREHSIRCSPAAELSSVSGEFEDLHVCGYELRHDDPELLTTLADFRADRGRRIWAMADRLEELGFALFRDELRARERAGQPLGRPHLADAVMAHPGQRRQARRRGHRRPRQAVPAVSRPRRGRVRRALAADGRGGDRRHPPRRRPRGLGASVLGRRGPATALAALDRFGAAGLDGVEAFYATHTEEQTRAARFGGARARAADHRLGRLPRTRARALQPLRRVRALRARAGARPAPPPGAHGRVGRRAGPRVRRGGTGRAVTAVTARGPQGRITASPGPAPG